jgi:hypothetical protein
VNYGLLAKFLRYTEFPPSLAEGSRAAWCDGASRDEWGNYVRGRVQSTLTVAVPKDPAKRPLILTFNIRKILCFFVCFHWRPWQATDVPQPSWLFVPPVLDVRTLATRCLRAYRRVPHSSLRAYQCVPHSSCGSWNFMGGEWGPAI